MDCDSVEALQAFALADAFVNQYGVDVFHVRQAYQFVDSSVVSYIAFQSWIIVSPFFCCHAEHRHI